MEWICEEFYADLPLLYFNAWIVYWVNVESTDVLILFICEFDRFIDTTFALV